jgi:hypothetical protein
VRGAHTREERVNHRAHEVCHLLERRSPSPRLCTARPVLVSTARRLPAFFPQCAVLHSTPSGVALPSQGPCRTRRRLPLPGGLRGHAVGAQQDAVPDTHADNGGKAPGACYYCSSSFCSWLAGCLAGAITRMAMVPRVSPGAWRLSSSCCAPHWPTLRGTGGAQRHAGEGVRHLNPRGGSRRQVWVGAAATAPLLQCTDTERTICTTCTGLVLETAQKGDGL